MHLLDAVLLRHSIMSATQRRWAREETSNEDVNFLRKCVEDRKDRLPKSSDPRSVLFAKNDILRSSINPISLLPMATANTMLSLGSSYHSGRASPGSAEGCYFPLPESLVWAGVVSLSMVTVGTVNRRVMENVLHSRLVSQRKKKVILNVMNITNTAITCLQAVVILLGGLLLFPQLGQVDMNDKESERYCDRGLVVFSTTVLVICWCCCILMAGGYAFIRYTAPTTERQVRSRLFHQLIETPDNLTRQDPQATKNEKNK